MSHDVITPEERAEFEMRKVFLAAMRKHECLKVVRWVRDGGVVLAKDGELIYYTEEHLLATKKEERVGLG